MCTKTAGAKAGSQGWKAFLIQNKQHFFFGAVTIFVMGQTFGKELMHQGMLTAEQMGFTRQEAPKQLQACDKPKKKEYIYGRD